MKLRRSFLAALAIGTILFSCGCATSYWENRLNDLADVGKVSLGLGGGLGLELQATDFVHPSFGTGGTGFCMGHENRHASGVWTQAYLFFPAATAVAALAGKDLPESEGVSSVQMVIYGSRKTMIEATRYMVWKDYYLLSEEKSKAEKLSVPWTRRMGVEATVAVWLVIVRAGVNPAELVDFALGFTTLDIAGDDVYKEEEGESED